jgi:phage replication O-like protein O
MKHTQIPNDILDTLIKARLSGTEYQVALLIIRKTIGFNKNEDWISLTQFENYTDKTRRSICKTIKSLVNKSILVKKSTLGKKTIYRLNQNFNDWKLLVNKSILVSPTRVKKGMQLVNKSIPTKYIYTKDIIDKSIRTEFGNPKINFLISSFKNCKGYPPTDRNLRRVAWNFTQRLDSTLKEWGREPNQENFEKLVTRLFQCYETKDWWDNIEKLETLKLKSVIFLSKMRSSNALPNQTGDPEPIKIS